MDEDGDSVKRATPDLEGRSLAPGEKRVRSYHEAGHALLALHCGVQVREIWDGDVARTIHDDASYQAASPRVRAMLALAGGVAEDVVFGQRSPGCCDEDIKKAEKILDELTLAGIERDALRAVLESEAREILSRPLYRAALDVLAHEISTKPYVVGSWALELLARNCPKIGPHLQVPLPVRSRRP